MSQYSDKSCIPISSAAHLNRFSMQTAQSLWVLISVVSSNIHKVHVFSIRCHSCLAVLCRYRDVITQQLREACGMTSQPVWRQSKEMLQEEGVEDVDTTSTTDDAVGVQVQVHSDIVCLYCACHLSLCHQKPHFPEDLRVCHIIVASGCCKCLSR